MIFKLDIIFFSNKVWFCGKKKSKSVGENSEFFFSFQYIKQFREHKIIPRNFRVSDFLGIPGNQPY